MTPVEQAARILPFIQAIAEGKTVEGIAKSGAILGSATVRDLIINPDFDYRIKREPREWFIKLPANIVIGIGGIEGACVAPKEFPNSLNAGFGECIHVREVIEEAVVGECNPEIPLPDGVAICRCCGKTFKGQRGNRCPECIHT